MEKNKKTMTRIKRLAAIFIAAALCIAFAGCGAQPAGSEAETSQSPQTTVKVTPTPEPKEGLEAVFGKSEITIAIISNSDEASSKLFFEGAKAEANGLGVKLEMNAAKSGFDSAISKAESADAVIACLIDDAAGYGAISAAVNEGVPVCVFEMENGSAPEGCAYIYYSPGNEVKLSFDAALTYPPHDTPVRLILLFESKESESYKEYKKLKDEGKIFPKEVYIASEEDKEAGAWLTGKLGRYVEGMIDGVYAENTGLALEALTALEAKEREDMEVFCAGVTPESVSRMANNSGVFAQSVGVNTYLAGVLSVRAALKALKGEGSVTLEIEPCIINASELKDGNAALLYMGGGQADVYNEVWMDELRVHYGTMAQ